jgi:hypothetical protein
VLALDKPSFGGNLPGRVVQFAPSQGVEQIACEEDALSLPTSKAFTGEMFGAPVHRLADLDPETAASHQSRLAREKLAVQPCRAWRTDLLLKGEVRPDREGEPLPAVDILISTRLDDRSGRGIAGEFKVRELKMVRPAIDPLNDGIGGAFQLVMQTSLHQAAEHGVAGVVAMAKPATSGSRPCPSHNPVHRLDDIAPNPEIAQRRLKARLQRPASRGDPFGQAQAFKLVGSAKHEPA